MRKDNSLYDTQRSGGTFSSRIWFNRSSSDELYCVDNSVLNSTGRGSIGYADADKNDSGKYTTVKRLTWQGYAPTAANVQNGYYDFWSNQWCYVKSDETYIDFIKEVMAFASNNGLGAYVPESA